MNLELDIASIFLIIQKIFFIILSLLFLVFSSIVVKQVKKMAKDIEDKLNPFLISLSFIQLAVSIFVIFLTIFWL
jgi:hypothetical protein